MIPSSADRKLLYGGTTVSLTGKYRVRHSTGHRPDTEAFLNLGLELPPCSVEGCVVSFELVLLCVDQFEHLRFLAAS